MTDRELMQMALDALELVTDLTNHDDEVYAAIEALCARLSQPEPEHRDVVIAGDLWRVEFLPNNDANVRLVRANYTASPQRKQRTYIARKWQGLTNEEIMDACSAVWASHPIEVGRVVEEKLKEKNS